VRYEINHRTSYSYASEVSVSHHLARLTPRALAGQQLIAHDLVVDPGVATMTHRDDYFGNRATFFTITSPHRTLDVISRCRVELQPRETPRPAGTPPWEMIREACKNGSGALYRQIELGEKPPVSTDATPNGTGGLPLALNLSGGTAGDPTDVREFIFPSPFVPQLPELADYAAESFPPERPMLEAVLHLTNRIARDFTFDPRATTTATPMEQVIKQRRGVCQDFAHFQIGCLRALGLPARYTSGYLETMPPPGKPKLVGADASHAWVQVYIPPAGWIDVDPTNNLLPSDRHVLLAWGRDFDDVSPIRGVIVGGGKHKLDVAVDVTPIV